MLLIMIVLNRVEVVRNFDSPGFFGHEAIPLMKLPPLACPALLVYCRLRKQSCSNMEGLRCTAKWPRQMVGLPLHCTVSTCNFFSQHWFAEHSFLENQHSEKLMKFQYVTVINEVTINN